MNFLPMLFNLYIINIFIEALENIKVGIKVNGTILNILWYEGDTAILANNEQELELYLNNIVGLLVSWKARSIDNKNKKSKPGKL